MPDYTSVLAQASELSLPDRLRLIEAVEATLGEDDFQLSPEWMAEIQRRCDALDAGTAQTVPWEDVRRGMSEIIEAARRDQVST